MASSEVEIASSLPYGCVLRDRNHREVCKEGNVKCTHTFQKNIKNFVMDLNTCMAVSSESTTTNENNNNNDNNNNNNNEDNGSSSINKQKAPKNKHLQRLCLTQANPFINTTTNDASTASLISPRHSRAARHTREMVSDLDTEVELLYMEDNDTLPRTSSSSSSEESSSSSKARNVGASSLVQIWENRMNQSSVSKPNTPRERIGSVSSPTGENALAFSTENVVITFSAENANALSAEEQYFNVVPSPSGNNVESFASSSFPDWESSDQSVSASPSCRSESDRVCVADLIRKLTSTTQNQSPTPSVIDDNEHEGYGSSVTGSPCREYGQQQQHPEQNQRVIFPLRIRGRQAYTDLLLQIENDRHGELNNLVERGAVSKFAQRGRIQALLRLKLMQRGVAANDPSRQKSIASEVVNRQPQGSATIMQLRQKFGSGTELRTPVQTEAAKPRSPQRETVTKITQLDNSASTTDQLKKDTSSQKGHGNGNGNANHATESTSKSASRTRIDHKKEDHFPSSDVKVQETHPSSDVKAPQCESQSQETAEAITSSSTIEMMVDRAETNKEQNAMAKPVGNDDETVNEKATSSQQYAGTSYEETVEGEASNQNYVDSSYYDDEMEEEVEEVDQNCYETNYDWISEISRPKSYWEERRQAWYREMRETGSQNDDIQRLLERRRVSIVLCSDFKDRMDRLMESHRGTQTHLVNSQDHEEDSQGLMAFLQDRLHSARAYQDGGDAREEEEESSNQDEEEEEEEEEDNADEHEEESLISGSYREAGNYSNRSSPWSYRDNEAGDAFDRAVSISPQPHQSPSFYQESRHTSSTNHHSMEMELIYDMRGQMEQLYNEISMLRKTIKSCMEMQMELQQSMKQEVQTVKKEEKKSNNNKDPKKENCCICYEMKVDTVLYRCGHMCTCLKCANELQWNSGKCPICHAKIVDVVRVYVEG